MNPIGQGYVRRVGDTSIAWWEIGEGEPIVLLHGVGDSHRTWRRVAPRLAERYRVLMPDLPGHGLSGKTDAPYTVPWFAETLFAWLDGLGVQRAPIVGHSYGGGVAQWMTIEQPERIERLALVAPGGLGRDVSLGLRLTTFPVLGPRLTPSLLGYGTRLMMRFGLGGRGEIEREEIERLAWMNSAPGSGVAFHRTLAAVIDMFGQHAQATARAEASAALPPIAVFWGEHDRVLPIRHAAEALARFSGAAMYRYAHSGHCPHLDESDRFARDLLAFLAHPSPMPVTLSLDGAARRRGAREAIGAVVRTVGARLRRASEPPHARGEDDVAA